MHKLILKLAAAGAGCLLLSPLASATDILDFTGSVTLANSSTQLGRTDRSKGVQQDWIGSEVYPGLVNATTTYNYITLTLSPFQLGNGPYAQITIDDPLTNVFVSAYANSYDPTNQKSNWLGDAGSSGNYFGTDPRYFQVVVPTGDSLVLVINTTAAAGLGETFTLNASNYVDTSYDDATPGVTVATPEPSSLLLLGAGGALFLGLLVRRSRRCLA